MDHPDTLADACAYAGVLDGLGRYAESRPLYEHALRVYRQIYGREHFEIAATLHNLAGVDFAEGDPKSASRRYRRALRIKECLLGRDHPEMGVDGQQPVYGSE